jgi:hypothetical protein
VKQFYRQYQQHWNKLFASVVVTGNYVSQGHCNRHEIIANVIKSMKIRGQGIVTGVNDPGNNFPLVTTTQR